MNNWINLLTEFNQEDYDRHRRAEGYEEGVADGIATGEARGKSIGIAEGARKTAIANAKNAFNMGLNPEQVAKITELPLEQVLELKAELENADK